MPERIEGAATARTRRLPSTLRTLLLLAALLAQPAGAAALQGLVINVADGDTLTVLDDQQRTHKVRLAGIDAPERGQPFGRRATEGLARLTRNQRVSVDGAKSDRYRRRIGVVRVAPGDCPDCPHSVDVGLTLIGAGLAWHYRAYEREQSATQREQYREAEAGARNRQQGLWRDAHPTPPWDWRQARRTGNGTRN